MRRRKFLQQSMVAGAGMMTVGRLGGAMGDAVSGVVGGVVGGAVGGVVGDAVGDAVGGVDFPVVRIPEAKRKFKSQAVEKIIREVRENIGNKELGWLFENCFPNTLDTTVDFSIDGGKPDTYVITGDIDAMWLRDSSAQVWPYLSICKEDKDLQQLIRGVIHRQGGDRRYFPLRCRLAEGDGQGVADFSRAAAQGWAGAL